VVEQQTLGHVQSSSLPFACAHFAPVRFTSPDYLAVDCADDDAPLCSQARCRACCSGPLLTPCFALCPSLYIGQMRRLCDPRPHDNTLMHVVTFQKGSRCSNPQKPKKSQKLKNTFKLRSKSKNNINLSPSLSRDLNTGPADYKSAALPTKPLRRHIL
jgi:hypothetical protein